MKKLAAVAVLLLVSLVAGQAVSVAGEPAGAAAKCKKPFKKKRGKCVFSPKKGVYSGGGVSLRYKTVVGTKIVQLFRGGPVTLKCKDGTTRQESVEGSGVRAVLKGASFKGGSADFPYTVKGKFTSTKAMKGTFQVRVLLPGAICTSGPVKFSAKLK